MNLTRRNLLAQGALGAAALLLPRWARADPHKCNPHFCPRPKPKYVSILPVGEVGAAAATE